MSKCFAKLLSFLEEFYWRRKIYGLATCFIVVLCYGFSLTSVSLNNDHSCFFKQTGIPFLSNGRWGASLLAITGLCDSHIPFWSFAIGLVFFVLSAAVWMAVINEATSGKIKKTSLFVFSLLFLSSPIHNEIFIYPGGFVLHSIGYLCIAFSTFILISTDIHWKTFAVSVFFAAMAYAIYESFVFVHLFAFATYLLLNALFLKNDKKRIHDLVYLVKNFAACLICGLIVSQGIGLLIRHVLGSVAGADRTIVWLEKWPNVIDTAAKLLLFTAYDYAYSGFFYFAIFVFVLSSVLFFWVCHRCAQRRMIIYVFALLVFGANFALSILKGESIPYRAAQVLPLFIGLSMMLFCEKSKVSSILKFLLVGWIVLIQSKEINSWAYYDYRVYEKNRANILKIGFDLKKQFGRYPKKPIIACNGYGFKRFEKFPSTYPLRFFCNMPRKNYINQHAGIAYFGGNPDQFQPLFHELTGLDITYYSHGNGHDYYRLIDKSKQPGWPLQGYIVEYDCFILVNLGECPVDQTKTVTPGEWFRAHF